MKYVLKSKTAGLDVAAFVDRMQQESLNGGRRIALGEFALEFPGLPALLIWDLLDARVPLDHQPTLEAGVDEIIVFWDGPLGAPEEYLYDWKALCFNVSGDKLDWLEAMLHNEDMMKSVIPTRRMPQARRPEPRLEVPVGLHQTAVLVNLFRINGQLVRDLPNDSPLFAADGDGWKLDNVDAAGEKHADPELVERELKEKPVELPDADE